MTRWRRQESSATLSANTISRCPSGCRLSSTPSRCSSQSSAFSTPGTTGAGERIPWRVAFQRATSLPSSVLGPPTNAPSFRSDGTSIYSAPFRSRPRLSRDQVQHSLHVICGLSDDFMRHPLLEPVRVVRVAQVAPYAAGIAVDAALPIVPLDLLASSE